MDLAINKILDKKNIKTILFDIIALSIFYFVPAISHMFSLPIYLIEPMRIFLILSIIFTNKPNSYLLALTLPLFSFIVSSHPPFYKMLLISSELVVNVYLFYSVKKIVKHQAIAIGISIISAKLYYYLVKFFLMKLTLIGGSLISTPIIPQVLVVIGLSILCFLLTFNKR